MKIVKKIISKVCFISMLPGFVVLVVMLKPEARLELIEILDSICKKLEGDLAKKREQLISDIEALV